MESMQLFISSLYYVFQENFSHRVFYELNNCRKQFRFVAFRLSVYRDFYFNISLRNNMNLWLVFDSEYPRRPSSLLQLNPTIKLILKLSVLCTFHPFFPLLAQPYLLSVFLFTLNSSIYTMWWLVFFKPFQNVSSVDYFVFNFHSFLLWI